MSSSPARRVYRVLLTAAAAILALIVAAYAAAPWLLAAAAKRFLASQGFVDVRVEIGYPGLAQLRVPRFEISGRGMGWRYALVARDLEFDYSLGPLRNGRIARLHVPDATLRLAPAPDEPAATRAAALPTPGRWVEAFPFGELVIGRLQIESRRADGSARTLTVGGGARQVADRIESRWVIGGDSGEHLQAALTLTAHGELDATVSAAQAPGRPVLTASAVVAPAGAGLRGRLDAELGPLGEMIALALPPALTPIAGRAQARWSWEPAAAAGDWRSTLTLDVSALQLGTSLRDGTLHLDATVTGREDALQWRIGERLLFSARPDPALLALAAPAGGRPAGPAPAPLVLRAPRGLGGHWSRTSAGDRLTVAGGAELAIAQLHTPDARLPALALALPGGLRLVRDAAGAWRNEDFEVTLRAPAIDTRLAALGRLEHLALGARIGAGAWGSVPPVIVREAAVNLLGGRVQGRDIRIGAGRSVFTLELEQLDLARIVALERQQEIEASGRLDGTLPVTLAADGASVTGGRLRAAAPGGVIRYHASEGVRAMGAGNPNLNLVLQALSNYHYDKLEVGVDYSPAGDLELAVAMTGRNPDWNAGQPIHLNINVEENVPVLLRSLRVAEDVGGEVEKRVRERPAAPR